VISSIAGRALNPVIQKFLQTVWGPLMVNVLLNHGQHSKEWKAAQSDLEKLVELSFQAVPKREAVDNLIDHLYSKLKAINFDSEQVAALISPPARLVTKSR